MPNQNQFVRRTGAVLMAFSLNHDLFVMERKKGNNVVFVVIDLSSKQISGTISDALPAGKFTEAFSSASGTLSSKVDLPGWGYRSRTSMTCSATTARSSPATRGDRTAGFKSKCLSVKAYPFIS